MFFIRSLQSRLAVCALGISLFALTPGCKPKSSKNDRIAPVVDKTNDDNCGFRLTAFAGDEAVNASRDLKMTSVDVREFLVEGHYVRYLDFKMAPGSKQPTMFVYKVCPTGAKNCKEKHSNLQVAVDGAIPGGAVKIEAWACRHQDFVGRKTGVRKRVNNDDYYCGAVHSTNDFRVFKKNKNGKKAKKWAYIHQLDQRIELAARSAYRYITEQSSGFQLASGKKSWRPAAVEAIRSVGPDHFAAMVKADYATLYQGTKDSEFLLREKPKKYALSDDASCVPNVDPDDVKEVPPVEEEPLPPPPAPPANAATVVAPVVDAVVTPVEEGGVAEGTTTEEPEEAEEVDPFAEEKTKCRNRDEWHRSEGTGQADWDSEYQVCWHTGATGQRQEIDRSFDPNKLAPEVTTPVAQAAPSKGGGNGTKIFGGVFLGLGTVIAAGGAYIGNKSRSRGSSGVVDSTIFVDSPAAPSVSRQSQYNDLSQYLRANGELLGSRYFNENILQPNLEEARKQGLVKPDSNVISSKGFENEQFVDNLRSMIEVYAIKEKELLLEDLKQRGYTTTQINEIERIAINSEAFFNLDEDDVRRQYLSYRDIATQFSAKVNVIDPDSVPIAPGPKPGIDPSKSGSIFTIQSRLREIAPSRSFVSRGGMMAGAAMMVIGGGALIFGLTENTETRPIDYLGYQIYKLSLKRKQCLEKNICK